MKNLPKKELLRIIQNYKNTVYRLLLQSLEQSKNLK